MQTTVVDPGTHLISSFRVIPRGLTPPQTTPGTDDMSHNPSRLSELQRVDLFDLQQPAAERGRRNEHASGTDEREPESRGVGGSATWRRPRR